MKTYCFDKGNIQVLMLLEQYVMRMGTCKWVIWYDDDTVTPISAVAEDRQTAADIGAKARPDEELTAVIREDEGATITVADDKLSTHSDPTRFITEVLAESPEETLPVNSTDVSGKENTEHISSDVTGSDVLDGDSIR